MTAFRDMAPYSPVEVYRRFRGAYCFHHQPDYGDSAHLRNIGLLLLSVVVDVGLLDCNTPWTCSIVADTNVSVKHSVSIFSPGVRL
jgi:hypothetical protein